MNAYSGDEFCTLHDECKKNVEFSRVCMRARLETPDGQRVVKLRAEIKEIRKQILGILEANRNAVLEPLSLVNSLNACLEI